jgi:hypothetical protein
MAQADAVEATPVGGIASGSPQRPLVRSSVAGVSALRANAEAARQELARVRRLVAESAQADTVAAVSSGGSRGADARSNGDAAPSPSADWLLSELRNSYEQLLSAQAAALQALQTELDASRDVAAVERGRAAQLGEALASALGQRDAAAAELARLPFALDAVTLALEKERAQRLAAEDSVRASLRREQEARALLLEAQTAACFEAGAQTEGAEVHAQDASCQTATAAVAAAGDGTSRRTAGVQTDEEPGLGNPLQAVSSFLTQGAGAAALLTPWWLPPSPHRGQH